MMLGPRTAMHSIADLANAKGRYVDLLAVAPSFAKPFSVGFCVGGLGLGLVPDEGAPGRGGVRAYCGVANSDAFARIVALGGRVERPVTDVAHGMRLASAVDPFGNVLSVIRNPHCHAAVVK